MLGGFIPCVSFVYSFELLCLLLGNNDVFFNMQKPKLIFCQHAKQVLHFSITNIQHTKESIKQVENDDGPQAFSICTYIYVYVYICIYIYVYICIYVYIYTYVYMHICIYVYMYMFINTSRIYARTFTYAPNRMDLCIYTVIYFFSLNVVVSYVCFPRVC